MFEKWHRKMDPGDLSLRQLPEAQSAPAELSQVLLQSQGTNCMVTGTVSLGLAATLLHRVITLPSSAASLTS